MKTGVIGLGAMGAPMAQNLAQAGLLSAVWNRTAAKAASLAQELKVKQASTADELARECRLILTCVSADEDLLEVIDQLLPGLNETSIIVDTSTVAIATVKQAQEKIAATGAVFIDAPVSGGVEGARQGTMVMMLGGAETVFDEIRPVLDAISSKQVLMGPAGSGQATKAVNQVMAAGINQAVSEALAFGDALGLDLDKVIEVLSGGAAGSWFLSQRGRTMVRQEYEPGFRLELHRKDLAICRQMAEEVAAGDNRLPLVEMTLIHYQRLISEGLGDSDISALYHLKRKLFTESNH